MKTIHVMSGLALSALLLLGACATGPRRPVPPAEPRLPAEPGARLADLDYLLRELPKRHPAFREKTPEARAIVSRFKASAAELRAALPGMRGDEALAGFSRLLASLGDGHTSLVIPAYSMLPIDLYDFEEGLYVTAAPRERQELLGKRLVAIDGVPIAEIRAAMAAVISHDNAAALSGQFRYRLVLPELLSGLGIIPEGAVAARLTVEDGEGGRSEVDLPFAVWAEARAQPDIVGLGFEGQLPLYRTRTREPYWCALVPGSKTLYLAYNSCREDPKKPMRELEKEVAAYLESGKVDRVLVDLRNNGGGSSGLFWPMERLLSRYATRPARGRAAIPVYVGIGRKTFSSAILNAVELRQGGGISALSPSSRAVFVGEPTGGRPNHYGDVRSLELPNSGLRVQYSTKHFRMWRDEAADTLAPDIPVPVRWADFSAGRDPLLAAVVDAGR